ncbi:hypothetical protein MTR67_041863 [Solanum verrucosum]|uniref:NADP-dependent oxidoreductase domain-containing protein n=1 Tax=Solanum verrucosum TaxID=315347 RepID=A0AAF0UN48_SOLVR|nr:hypothetical protein MTR67_041863 [Solanum verrucosum]
MKMGSQGLEVSAQGLGCMGMSAFYGPPKPDDEMIKLIHHSINSGVTFLDTSDIYGPYTNEILIGKALKGETRERVELATKFGINASADGKIEIIGDPSYVRASCEASLKRLDVNCIDLYYQHRVDTLQLEWSLWSRDVEEEIIPICRELGIGIVAYSPLGKGFLSSGPKLLEDLSNEDFWKHIPRFQAENLEHNKILYERICQMATKKRCKSRHWMYAISTSLSLGISPRK